MISTLNSASSTTAATTIPNSANELNPNSFMTLLTTQLQQQDPTQAQDPTQFVNQLVSFNSLEQLVQINQTLTSMGPVAAATGSQASPTSSTQQ